ncbi:MAG: hypothetical protein ACTHM1_05735 [Solirubrobacteraceae bacterium]
MIRTRILGALAACAAVGFTAAEPTQSIASGTPQWTVTAVSQPTNLPPGAKAGEAAFVVRVTNTGSAASEGPVTITEELPEGLTLGPEGASGVDLLASNKQGSAAGAGKLECVLRACTYRGSVPVDDSLTVTFPVDVAAKAPAQVTNVVRVAGGSATSAYVETPTEISSSPAAFGIAPGGASTALSSYQAGAHADLTTSIAFDTLARQGQLPADPKDTTDVLPPGFAGDLVDTPTCQPTAFLAAECPADTQVGIVTVALSATSLNAGEALEPLYNLAPTAGYVAKLGFNVADNLFYEGNVAVRPADYGLETTFYDATAGVAELDEVSLTVWGVPAAAIHDPLRYKPSERVGSGEGAEFGDRSEAAPVPYLSNPTSCTMGWQPISAAFKVNSWQQPARYVEAGMPFGPLVGCDHIDMEPSLRAEPTTTSAESPTGLDVTMNVPQTYGNAAGLATSTLSEAVVTLPEGMTVNPSAGAGLEGCSEAQYGEETARYQPGSGCPPQSKLGSVRIVTPSLKEEVTGAVYLAQPYANPFKSLLALYIVARLPERGILVRAAGEVAANPLTGRLVTVFKGLPPLPFSTFTLSFRQGETSPLVTPAACGSFQVGSALTPYASPTQSLSVLAPAFSISTGVGGSACPAGGAPPFKPSVVAGTESNRAGSYSPLYLRVERRDGEQEMTGFGAILPPGLTGNLSGVEKCGDAEIEHARSQTGAQAESEPACPASSDIGSTIAEAGVGSVLVQTPGRLYLAGPFEGAPLSVVDVTSAKVGPFDLGTVVVRLPLRIDPITAQVSIPSGPADQIPHIIDGIVIHLRDIRVYVDRQGFMINPTSCETLGVQATVVGAGANVATAADDQPASVADRFQAADCASLAFKPSFEVSTSGKTSRKDGASLHVSVAYPSDSLGKSANLRYVKVELPKHLPSRLNPTLQNACTARQFAANPAGCPEDSLVGTAVVRTPILPVPLTGPAYFVSNGGAEWPELVIVLQGYGITVDLHGETFISKGITSSTFRSAPDVPFETFELNLPAGPHSALAANGDLCTEGLTMPTTFVAQNGASLHESAPIEVQDCPYSLRVLGRRASKRNLTLKVSVPTVGKLTASGNGVLKAAASAKRRQTLTLSIKERHAGKLRTRITLRFTPKTGKQRKILTKTITFTFT